MATEIHPRSRSAPPAARRRLGLVTALALALMPAVPAHSQSWRLQPELATQLTATNNSHYGDTLPASSDRILELSPRLRLYGSGARFRLDADVGFDALYYLGDTRDDRVEPRGRVELESTLVERWLDFDAILTAEQTAADPYAAQPREASSANRLTTRRLRLSPTLDHRFSPSLWLYGRSDNTWTRRNGEHAENDPRRDAFEQQHFLKLEQKPQPFGLTGELLRQESRFNGEADPVLGLTSARLVLGYARDPQLEFGAVIGRERSRYSLTEHTDTIRGLRLRWLPTDRTQLRLSVERRFFGTGWDAEFTHRTPLFAVQLRSFREPTTQPASQILSPQDGDVASLLDAILTTRHPDPVQRATLVRAVMDELGLPAVLNRPVEVFSDYAQLERGTSLSVALLGRRTTVSFGLEQRQRRQLRRADDPLAPETRFDSDNEQRVFSIDFNRRLSPRTTFDLWAGYSRLQGLGAREGDRTTEKTLRLTLSHALSPRATVSVGVRRQLLATTVSASSRETAVFAGLSQRF